MNNYVPEHALKKRRISAVKKALNKPNLPKDMVRYWQRVLTHLVRSKTMITKPEIVMQQLVHNMEEIISLLEEIQHILKKSTDFTKRDNVIDFSNNEHKQ
jgi:hypothetical protein